MTLKKAKLEDYIKIETLAKEIWPECYKNILSENQINYMLELFLSAQAIENQVSENYIYELILEDEETIGFISYKLYPNYLLLSKAYILEKYRNKNIFSSIITKLEQTYQKPYIELTVNKLNIAVEAYKKLNFEIVKDVKTEIGQGYYMDDYIMQKKLEEGNKVEIVINPLKSILYSILFGFIGAIPAYFCLIGYGDIHPIFFVFIPILAYAGYRVGKNKKYKFLNLISIVDFIINYLIINFIYLTAYGELHQMSFKQVFQVKEITKELTTNSIYSIILVLATLIIIKVFVIDKKKK